MLMLLSSWSSAVASSRGICAASVVVAGQEVEGPQQSTTGPEPPANVAPKTQQTLGPEVESLRQIDVPGYAWRHGCGPTALGMVVGYYDDCGYDELIPGSAATQTASVDQAIASQRNPSSPGHYEDYSMPIDSTSTGLLPDKSEPPPGDEHTDDCIADFMRTSWSSQSNYYGWSWSTHMGPAFISYVELQDPDYVPSYQRYWTSDGSLNWNVLTQEIDGDHPMVFLVDTDGNGETDHFVTVVGYHDTPTQQYGCLDTWAPADVVRWCDFQPISSGQPWGVWGGWSFHLEPLQLLGDLDGDGDVDLDDYSVLAAFMNGPDQPAGNPEADLDGDGDCDLADVAILAANFPVPL